MTNGAAAQNQRLEPISKPSDSTMGRTLLLIHSRNQNILETTRPVKKGQSPTEN